MAIIACGINHKTAPLAIREHLAKPMDSQAQRLTKLLTHPHLQAAMLLSTCNRHEMYCETDTPEQALLWFAQAYDVHLDQINSALYYYADEDAVHHMLKVASGVDSMMLGEPQILGQMKSAYQQAEQCGAMSSHLRLMCSFVFGASKRIRHQSGISNNPISVASAAVRLLGQTLPNYPALHVFIIGSGETGALVAKYLQQHGVTQFTVVSRTENAARELAEKLNGSAYLTINEIPTHLARADVIISATSCPLPFITPTMVSQALIAREQKPMFFIDLAVPRDIEPEVGELAHVHLINIDDLHQCIEQGLNERRAAAVHAHTLIAQELDDYNRWNRSRQAKDIICDYRQQMQTLAQHELSRAHKKLAAGHCQYQVIEELCARLVNKLTHTQTIELRHAASNHQSELV
jgi:glutamyl-tRNA reductase